MFRGRDIAEEIGAGGRRDGSSDGRDDVVVAGSDVRDEGAQDVERGFVADAFLELDVHLDLVERNVTGPFDHDLDVRFVGAFHQLPQGQELFDLGAVGGVDDGARAGARPRG